MKHPLRWRDRSRLQLNLKVIADGSASGKYTLGRASSLAEETHIKTREESQQTKLDMREFLAIDKALQSIQGELLNNTAKLTEINKRIRRDTKKLEEVQDDRTYSDEQKQLYKDRLDDLDTEKMERLEILSQN